MGKRGKWNLLSVIISFYSYKAKLLNFTQCIHACWSYVLQFFHFICILKLEIFSTVFATKVTYLCIINSSHNLYQYFFKLLHKDYTYSKVVDHIMCYVRCLYEKITAKKLNRKNWFKFFHYIITNQKKNIVCCKITVKLCYYEKKKFFK